MVRKTVVGSGLVAVLDAAAVVVEPLSALSGEEHPTKASRTTTVRHRRARALRPDEAGDLKMVFSFPELQLADILCTDRLQEHFSNVCISMEPVSVQRSRNIELRF